MGKYHGPAHMSQEQLARVHEWAAAIVDATPIETFRSPPQYELQLEGSQHEDRAWLWDREPARQLIREPY